MAVGRGPQSRSDNYKMKFIAALAALATFAQAQRVTDNDCFAEEGAVYEEDCNNLFYKLCNKFKIDMDDSCNVITYGDAAVEWYSGSIDVKYWGYSEQYVRIDNQEEEVVDENDWADWNWRLRQDAENTEEGEWAWECVQDSDIPEAFNQGGEL